MGFVVADDRGVSLDDNVIFVAVGDGVALLAEWVELGGREEER